MISRTNAAPGREDEYRQYALKHGQEVLDAVPAFTSAQLHELHAIQRPAAGPPSPYQFMTLYDIDGTTGDTVKAVDAGRASGAISPNNGALAPGGASWVYDRMGEPVVGGTPLPGAARHVYVGFLNAGEGREDEFNAWYDGFHLREWVTTMPGFVSGQRWRVSDEQRPEVTDVKYRYVTIYQVEGDDIAEMNRLGEVVRAQGNLTPHNGAMSSDIGFWLFTKTGPYLTK